MLVRDIYKGGNTSNPSDLINVNGTLYFTAIDEHSGYQVWKSNGTEAGTVKVLEVNGFSKPTKLTDVGGILYFSVDDGLWRSDGTETGHFPIAILPHDDLTNVNGTLFPRKFRDKCIELWKSDGTESGTVL